MKKVIVLLVTGFLLLFARGAQAQGSRIGLSVHNDSVTVIILSLGEDEEVFYKIQPKDSENPQKQNTLPLELEQTFLIPQFAHEKPHELTIFIQKKDGTVAEEKSFEIEL